MPANNESDNPYGPSRILILKDWGEPGRSYAEVRTVQLPFDQVIAALMGVTSKHLAIYDVSELLEDLDRLRAMVLDITKTCTVHPWTPKQSARQKP